MPDADPNWYKDYQKQVKQLIDQERARVLVETTKAHPSNYLEQAAIKEAQGIQKLREDLTAEQEQMLENARIRLTSLT